MTASVLKSFTTNTAWTYTMQEDCYIQIVSPAGQPSSNSYIGKITVKGVEIERYVVDSTQTAGGWVGTYSKVYYCKKGDVIASTAVNASLAYKAVIVKWS